MLTWKRVLNRPIWHTWFVAAKWYDEQLLQIRRFFFKIQRIKVIMSYLSQLFIEVWSIYLGFLICFFMIEIKVPTNKERPKKFLHLNRDIQWNGYNKVVEHQESKKIWNKSQYLWERSERLVFTKWNVFILECTIHYRKGWPQILGKQIKLTISQWSSVCSGTIFLEEMTSQEFFSVWTDRLMAKTATFRTEHMVTQFHLYLFNNLLRQVRLTDVDPIQRCQVSFVVKWGLVSDSIF